MCLRGTELLQEAGRGGVAKDPLVSSVVAWRAVASGFHRMYRAYSRKVDEARVSPQRRDERQHQVDVTDEKVGRQRGHTVSR